MAKTSDNGINNALALSYTGGGIVVAYVGQTTLQVKSERSKYNRDEIEG